MSFDNARADHNRKLSEARQYGDSPWVFEACQTSYPWECRNCKTQVRRCVMLGNMEICPTCKQSDWVLTIPA